MQKTIQKLLIKNQGLLEKVKRKLLDEGKKAVLKYKSKLPTPETLIDKFTSQVCTRSSINKAEQNYQKIKAFAKKIQNALEKAQKALEKLKSLIEKVLDILTKILALIATVAIIISILSKVVLVAKILIKGVGMTPPPSTAPSGPIILADKAATLAEGKILILKTLSKSVNDKVTKIKLAETISVLNKTKIGKVVSDSHVSSLMISYELIKELKDKVNGK